MAYWSYSTDWKPSPPKTQQCFVRCVRQFSSLNPAPVKLTSSHFPEWAYPTKSVTATQSQGSFKNLTHNSLQHSFWQALKIHRPRQSDNTTSRKRATADHTTVSSPAALNHLSEWFLSMEEWQKCGAWSVTQPSLGDLDLSICAPLKMNNFGTKPPALGVSSAAFYSNSYYTHHLSMETADWDWGESHSHSSWSLWLQASRELSSWYFYLLCSVLSKMMTSHSDLFLNLPHHFSPSSSRQVTYHHLYQHRQADGTSNLSAIQATGCLIL